MSVDPYIRDALLDIEAVIRSETSPEKRLDAFDAFLLEASDIAFRGRCVALMDLLDSGLTQAEVAERAGVTPRTVNLWIKQAAEVTGRPIPRSPRHPRVTKAVSLPEKVAGRYRFHRAGARGARASS